MKNEDPEGSKPPPGFVTPPSPLLPRSTAANVPATFES